MKHLGEYVISNKALMLFFDQSVMLMGICHFFTSVDLNDLGKC